MAKRRTKEFAVSIWYGDFNQRIGNSNWKQIKWTIKEFDTIEETVKEFKKQAKKHIKLSEGRDWKFYSKACGRFFWDEFGTEVISYIKVLRDGEEYSEWDEKLLDD